MSEPRLLLGFQYDCFHAGVPEVICQQLPENPPETMFQIGVLLGQTGFSDQEVLRRIESLEDSINFMKEYFRFRKNFDDWFPYNVHRMKSIFPPWLSPGLVHYWQDKKMGVIDVLTLRAITPDDIFVATAKSNYLAYVHGRADLEVIAGIIFQTDDYDFVEKAIEVLEEDYLKKRLIFTMSKALYQDYVRVLPHFSVRVLLNGLYRELEKEDSDD